MSDNPNPRLPVGVPDNSTEQEEHSLGSHTKTIGEALQEDNPALQTFLLNQLRPHLLSLTKAMSDALTKAFAPALSRCVLPIRGVFIGLAEELAKSPPAALILSLAKVRNKNACEEERLKALERLKSHYNKPYNVFYPARWHKLEEEFKSYCADREISPNAAWNEIVGTAIFLAAFDIDRDTPIHKVPQKARNYIRGHVEKALLDGRTLVRKREIRTEIESEIKTEIESDETEFLARETNAPDYLDIEARLDVQIALQKLTPQEYKAVYNKWLGKGGGSAAERQALQRAKKKIRRIKAIF